MGVTVAATRVAANTTTGIQSITTTDLGGLTPKAVLLIATRCVTDGVAADGAGWYMGASDGTNEWAQGYEDQHAVASVNTEWEQDTIANRILTIYDGSAADVVEGQANFSAWVTNGVEIDWVDAPAGAFLITAVFFAGSDLTVHVGTQALGNTADALIDITSLGFEADVVICMLLEGTSIGQPEVSLGLIHNDRAGTVTQRCAAHYDRDGFGTAFCGVMVRDSECLFKHVATGNIDFYGAATSFDSSGFSIQLGNARSPANAAVGWLALRFGSSPVVQSKVYTLSTPTATGSANDTGAGFEPQFVMYLPTFAEVVDTNEADADAGTIGLAVLDADEQYCSSIQSDDGPTTTNTQSLSDNVAINLPADDGAAGMAATMTAFISTGVTLNWTDIEAAAKLYPALAIEASAGGTAYTQSVSGAITPAGALVRDGRKVVAGAITPAGDLLKQAQKALAGTLTSSGALTSVRTFLKSLDGTLTSAGTLARETSKALGGMVTTAGTLARQTGKTLSGALTPVGDLLKQAQKVLAGTLTSSGALTSVRTFLKSLEGTLTSAGTLARETGKTLTGTLTSSGALVRQVNKTLIGTLTPSGAASKQVSKVLSGILATVGALAAQLLGQAKLSVDITFAQVTSLSIAYAAITSVGQSRATVTNVATSYAVRA